VEYSRDNLQGAAWRSPLHLHCRPICRVRLRSPLCLRTVGRLLGGSGHPGPGSARCGGSRLPSSLPAPACAVWAAGRARPPRKAPRPTTWRRPRCLGGQRGGSVSPETPTPWTRFCRPRVAAAGSSTPVSVRHPRVAAAGTTLPNVAHYDPPRSRH